ncbi:phospholipid-transporting ATPase ABCA1-like, partial [Physella acuta]|uniref:phospholipid-transporting ATPase ABCA1-like n=1 Tax=Physella acuta TaxID=109671 RepID=UPI0027DDA7CC
MSVLLQLRLLLWKNLILRKRQPLRVIVEIIWPLALFLILITVRFRPGIRENIGECHYTARAMPSAGIFPFLSTYVCNFNNDCYHNAGEADTQNKAQLNGSTFKKVLDVLHAINTVSSLDALSNLQENLQLLTELQNVSLDQVPEIESLKLADLISHRQELLDTSSKQGINMKPGTIDSFLNATLNMEKMMPILTDLNSTNSNSMLSSLIPFSEHKGRRSSNQPLPGSVQKRICDDEIISEYLYFQNETQAKEFNTEFCNLTNENATAFVSNVLNAVNVKKANTMISEIMERQPFITSVVKLRNIMEKLSNLSSLSELMSSLGSLIEAFNSVNTSIGQVMCGHNRKIFDFDSKNQQVLQNMQKSKNKAQLLKKAKEQHEKSGMNTECAELFANFETDTFTRLVWNQIKPIVIGVITFTPDSVAVQKIIKEASRTFDSIKSFFNLTLGIQAAIPRIMKFAKEDWDPFTKFIYSPECKNTEAMFKNFSKLLSPIPNSLPSLMASKNTSCEEIAHMIAKNQLNDTDKMLEALNRTDKLITRMKPYFKCTRLDKFIGYSDTKSLIDASLSHIQNKTFWSAIVFDNISNDSEEIPTLVKYRIRMSPYSVDSTDRIMDKYWRPGNRDGFNSLKYWIYGFIYIQDMIDHAIIRLHTNVTQEPGVYTKQAPYGCYIDDRFTFAISRSLPLFMVISWIYTVAMTVKGIVYEKEERLKEIMKIMGLSNGVHWLAWFIDAFSMMFMTVILFVTLLKAGKILEYSDPSVILVFMIGFTCSTISQCFLISVFFNKANLAAVCGGFIYFVLYLPYTQLVQFEDVITTNARTLASLSSNIAMGYACSYFSQYEEQAIGAQWHNIRESPMVDDTFNLKTCIGMLYLDSVIYLFLTWYIEAVFPGQYGIPRKWYFLIQRSYWQGTKHEQMDEPDTDMSLDGLTYSNDNFEKDPTGRPIGVAVKNLRKIYNKGDKIAVDGLTLNFYEGQITSFLGHNGAGKTTTMSILTGLFPQTSGSVYIYGHNILTDADKVRCGLGMCPQHNVLFDLLTVEEHIWFFARLKGRSDVQVKEEMEKMIQDVGLVKKQKEMSKYLSGGMKRKLSVAIAFVGGSKTVILDEPTAGVDPYARRAIWELLLKFRKGRTIILSTHHMDEADVLGDRIAIISQGKLCTVGTSLFLKKKFGSGYYLTLVPQENDGAQSLNNDHLSLETSSIPVSSSLKKSRSLVSDVSFIGSSVDSAIAPGLKPKIKVNGYYLPQLISFIQTYFPDALLVKDNNLEVCFRLPEGDNHIKKCKTLCAALQEYHLELGISSYGISDTSLEEVFLRVAQQNNVFDQDKKIVKDMNETSDAQEVQTDRKFNGEVKITGNTLILRQLIAIFLKRFHHARRSRKGFISEIILPAAFVCLAMFFSLLLPPQFESEPLELQPWMYEPIKGDDFLYSFYSNEDPTNLLTTTLGENLLHEPFYGTRCMNSSIYQIKNKPCIPLPKMEWHGSHLKENMNGSPACSCKTGFQSCPEGAGGPEPPKIKLWTKDYLYNTTNLNLSDWLVKTYSKYQKRRYGGYSFGHSNKVKVLTAEELSNTVDRLKRTAESNKSIYHGNAQLIHDAGEALKYSFASETVTVWFNNKGWAASVSYMNALNNLILRTLLSANKTPNNYGIVAINHPMILTSQEIQIETIHRNAVNVVASICVIFAMSFVPASFVLYLIEERVSNSKHLQFVSGIKPTVYWLANWAWDMLNYAVPAVLCVLIFIAFGKEAYVSATNLPCLIVLLFSYGWAMTPMMYPFSRLFDVPSSAFVALSCANVFFGTVSTLATFILEVLSFNDPELANVNDILKQVFLMLPHYCLGRGLIDMAALQLTFDAIARFEETYHYNVFEWSNVGRNIFALIIHGLLFNVLNLLMEYKFFLSWECLSKQPALKTRYEDVDVAREKQRVLSGGAVNDVLRLEGLTKVFWKPGKKGKITVVDHLYLGVPKGQCFGLLGVNGAGKTTTFKMLTGGITATSGDAFIHSYSINDKVKVCKHMGYCPQFDALDPLLTGREHLEFYARVRGVAAENIQSIADWAIKRLGLVRHADKISSSYSGGNKRKLSTAIALIGNPPIIFLDEPTTGMDPAARRFLWNCINNIVKSGHSVILTSHSMEECEALCNRLAIMVNGTFQCLGSIQHLKNRFGNGYTIILRVSGENPDVNSIGEFISLHLPSARLREQHCNMLQ